MKSYSVKSNAKRFARGLAAKNQSLEVMEPVETEDGSGEWLPVVKVVGEADKLAIFKQFRDVAIIYGLALDSVLAAEANGEGDAGVYAVPPDDLGEALANEDAVIAAEGIRPEDGVDVSHMVGAIVISETVTVDLPYGPEQAAIVDRLLTEGHTVVAADHSGAMVKHEPDFTLEVGEGGDVATSRVEFPVTDWHTVSALDPAPAETEGEAIDLSTKRTASFPGARVVFESTPGGALYEQRLGRSVRGEPGKVPVIVDVAKLTEGFEEPAETVLITGRGDKTGVVVMKGTDAGKTTSVLDEIEEGDAEAEERLSPADVKAVAAALATLPPRVKRTPAEIAQAREERRARIEAGAYKAPAVAATKDVKVPKSTLVYEAIKAEGGASFVDLIALTDWQKHTLRGYIAGTLRKRAKAEGLEIEAFKVKGEPTRYRAQPL